MLRAVILGVDDALLRERAASAAALAASCGPLEARLGLPEGLLGEAIAGFTEARFSSLDGDHGFGPRHGVAPEECLWAALGDEADRQLPALPALAAAVRRTVFADALAAVGAPPDVAPVELEVRYGLERRRRIAAWPDAAAVVSALRDRGLTLVALAEGATEVARERLRVSGAEPWFDLVVLAAEEGLPGAEPALLQLACDRAGVRPEQALYVGARLARGVQAALQAELRTLWLSRGDEPAGDIAPAMVACELSGVLGFVDGLRAGRAFRVMDARRSFVAVDEPERGEDGRWGCRVGPERDPLRHTVAAATPRAAVQAALRSLRARSAGASFRHELGEEVDWDAILR